MKGLERGSLTIRDADSVVVVGAVRLDSLDPDDDCYEGEVDVTLDSFGLAASATVRSGGIDELPAWLAGLAGSFRGWKGMKRWSTVDDGFVLRASHDGAGHVNIWVTISAPDGLDPDYTATTRIAIDAGEDLRLLAETAAAVIG